MIEFESEEEEADGGIPAWMATFADLMSLLMCFFVLLLSFSEMDVLKYKQIAGSMRNAFGVQNELNVKDAPKGTSVIAQEFSPGRPEPTPLNEIRQHTTDSNESTLDTRVKVPGKEEKSLGDLAGPEAKLQIAEKLKQMISDTENIAKEIATQLSKEVKAKDVEVNNAGLNIVIRIMEKGSFDSGSATLKEGFKGVAKNIRILLRDIEGKVIVEGHTDNIPISTPRFKSNWDLSSARALAVTNELLLNGTLDENRFRVTGFSSTKPHVANDSRDNRAKNRRVEIVIRRDLAPDVKEKLQEMKLEDPGILDTLDMTEQDRRAIEDLL